jgi:transposase-like protein
LATIRSRKEIRPVSSVIPFAPYFHDEHAAYAFVEACLWPNGSVCPHCGSVDRSGKLGGKSTRVGLYKCYDCRKPFTVKLGTLFEGSNLKLHIWLRAMYLLCARGNRVSSGRLHEILGVTAKTAWLVRHRIRESMRQGTIPAPLAAAFANGRTAMPRPSGTLAVSVPAQRSWSTSWNMTADHRHFTQLPTISRRRKGAWWVGQTEGSLE